MTAEVDRRLAQDREDRQRYQRADQPVELQPEQQREDHEQRVDAQRVGEDLRGYDVPLDLLQADEQQDHPGGGDRVCEQRDEHGGQRGEDRGGGGHERHQPVEDGEHDRVLAPVGEDPEHAEQVQREPGGGAHHEAEQQLPADVARDRVLDERRVVVGVRTVAGGHRAAHELADGLAVEQQVDREHEHEHEVEDGGGRFGEQPAAEGGDLAGALVEFVLDRSEERRV